MITPLDSAAYNAVNICMHVKPEDKVYILSDRASTEIAESLGKYARKACYSVELHYLDNYVPQGALDPHQALDVELPGVIKDCFRKTNVSFCVTAGTESPYLFKEIVDEATKGRRRHAHSSGIDKSSFIEGVHLDQNEVKAFTNKVFNVASCAREMHVTNSLGTDFIAEFCKKFKWIPDHGVAKTVDYIDLPNGETETCPINVRGTIYTNLLGDTFDAVYGYLKSPLSYKVKDSRVQKDTVKCADDRVKVDFLEYISRQDGGDEIGEYGLGTSPKLIKKQATIGLENKSKVLLVEKANVHIAEGMIPDKRIKAPSKKGLNTHIDNIIERSNVDVMTYGGRRLPLMRNGLYNYTTLDHTEFLAPLLH